MKISRPPLGRAYAGGRSEFATQWRPAATRSMRWGAVAAAHPPYGMNGALHRRLRLKT
jgi:hypothetical protein